MLGGPGTGGTPFQLGTAGQGGTPHRGVATVIKDKLLKGKNNALTTGLKVQLEVFKAYDKPKADTAWKSLHEDQMDLKVLAMMGNGKRVRFIWGVGKLFDPSNEMDITWNDSTAFIGNRDKHGNAPSLVGLPPQNSVNWVKVTTKFDEAAFEAHYDNGANADSFINVDSGGGGSDAYVSEAPLLTSGARTFCGTATQNTCRAVEGSKKVGGGYQ